MGIRRVENMCGGKGHVIIKDILEGDELKEKLLLHRRIKEVTVNSEFSWWKDKCIPKNRKSEH